MLNPLDLSLKEYKMILSIILGLFLFPLFFYGAPHENGSNPDVHLREVNKKAVPQLKVHGGFMKDKFIEQSKPREKSTSNAD